MRSLTLAFIIVENDAPSAVNLDHALSDGESSQLCKYLKGRNIPYVLHSGYTAREQEWAADKAVYVPKCASPQLLVTAVEGLLCNRQQIEREDAPSGEQSRSKGLRTRAVNLRVQNAVKRHRLS
jgi:hypothetical protein